MFKPYSGNGDLELRVYTPNMWTSRLQKGGALFEDMRQLVCGWPEQVNHESPEKLVGDILSKPTRSRAADVYTRSFLPRFIEGSPPNAWRLARILEDALPSVEIVRPFYYWITARAEPILYAFVIDQLSEKRKSADSRIRIEDTVAWIHNSLQSSDKIWSPAVELRVAQGLLACLRDFGFLEGRVHKHLAPYHLPLESFCIIAFLLDKFDKTKYRLVDHPDWGLFFLNSNLVERLFLEVHQYGWINYQTAGGIQRIEFPTHGFEEYVHAVVRGKS